MDDNDTPAPPDHELRLMPDDKYRHLFNPQCRCGWSSTGFVPTGAATHFYSRHLESAPA